MGIFNNEEARKDYDENGNWCTDYMNMDVPFGKLRIPKTKHDNIGLHLRFQKEFGDVVKRICNMSEARYINLPSTQSEIEKGPILEGYEDLVKEIEESEGSDDEEEQVPYEIWFCDYPTLNLNGAVFYRPCVVATLALYNTVVTCGMMVTNIRDKKLDPYDAELEDWKEEGLRKESAAKTDNIRPTKHIKFHKYLGTLTQRDMRNVLYKFSCFMDEAFDNPWNFFNWMMMVGIDETPAINGSNNNQKIQTLDDIKKSFKANCVDIAVNTYRICKDKFDATIGWIRWIVNENKTDGHLFCVFKANHKVYTLQYMQGDHIGEISTYSNKTYLEVVLEEGKKLKPHIDKKHNTETKQLVYVFTKTDLKTFDNESYLRTHTQKEVLDKIWPM